MSVKAISNGGPPEESITMSSLLTIDATPPKPSNVTISLESCNEFMGEESVVVSGKHLTHSTVETIV